MSKYQSQCKVGSNGMTIRKPVKLSNGRVVVHKRLDDDVQEAFMEDGGEMSVQEWDEYCAAIMPARKEVL